MKCSTWRKTPVSGTCLRNFSECFVVVLQAHGLGEQPAVYVSRGKLVSNFLITCKYRKIPVISPGLIQLRKGFGWAYKRRRLYPGGGAHKRD